MYCKKCGTKNINTGKYCFKCGEPLQTRSTRKNKDNSGDDMPKNANRKVVSLSQANWVVIVTKTTETALTIIAVGAISLLILPPAVIKGIPIIGKIAETQISFIMLLKTLLFGDGSLFNPTMLSITSGVMIGLLYLLTLVFWIWNIPCIINNTERVFIWRLTLGFSVAFGLSIFVFSSIWPFLTPDISTIPEFADLAGINPNDPSVGFINMQVCVFVVLVLLVVISVLRLRENAPDKGLEEKKQPVLLFALLIVLTIITASVFFFSSIQNTSVETHMNQSVFAWSLVFAASRNWFTGTLLGLITIIWFAVFLFFGIRANLRVLQGKLTLTDVVLFTIVSILQLTLNVTMIVTINLQINERNELSGIGVYTDPLKAGSVWITCAFILTIMMLILFIY